MVPILLAACILAQPAPTLPREVMHTIDAAHAKAVVEKLASFGTRHTLSDTTSDTRGIGAARRWLKSELESFGPALRVQFEEFDAPPGPRMPQGGRIVNVVATLPGAAAGAARRACYVVGHYDTMNADRMDAAGDAPGANDDASGVAVVLECARALAGRELETTIVFLCTAGEEQGLLGAKLHADALGAEERFDTVWVLNNDIVGDPSPALLFEAPDKPTGLIDWQESRLTVRVFSEGLPRNPDAQRLATIRLEGAENDSASRQLARFVAFVARRESTALRPMLVFRLDRFLRGGDHSAFNEAGFSSVRFSVPAEDYSRQHANVTERDGQPYGDVARFVDGEYLANVARLNAATLVHLASAPAPPGKARVITAKIEEDTLLRWEQSADADIAGYEVVWRRTTSADWEFEKDVRAETEARLKVSKDNFFFGVRAYDRDGYRSPVSFAWAARE